MITPISLRHPNGSQIAFEMDLDPDFVSDRHILEYAQKHACYESEVAWVMMRALRHGDNVVDVGACVGFFTLLASKLVGLEGRVVSVEPSQDNLEKLNRNLDLNRCGNVDVIPRPLFSKSEMLKFYHNADSSGGHALWPPENWPENVKTKESPSHEMAGAITLNHAAPVPLRLIKIDTEGAEEHVLRGGNNVLAVQRPPFIIAEINAFGLNQMGTTPEHLRAYMRLHGYEAFSLQKDGRKPEYVPAREPLFVEYIWNALFSTKEAVEEVWG